MLSNRRGFTIVEMFVVLVIGLIVGSLSMGQFSAYLARERVARATEGIANDIRAAFAIPGRIRRPVRIRIDTAAMMLLVTDRSQSTTYRKTAFGSRYNLLGKNVTYYPSTAPYEIYPYGLASDTMLVTLTSNGLSKSIRVSKGGMVQVK